jgi:protein-L-isoaspartate(D-aspartate) O-methyltransferase
VNIEDCRRFYAEEIQLAAGLRSARLIEAFARVPREEYLGPGPWEVGSPEARGMSMSGGAQVAYVPVSDPRSLYHNVVISLKKDEDINNGQPSALGRWIEALEIEPGERVYHLGCGVGYYTAILAEMAGPDGSVQAIDFSEELAGRAKRNLSPYPSVTVQAADGAIFDPGVCDAMLINAGMTHPLPQLLDRLSESGRMVVPLTTAIHARLGAGFMVKIIRQASGFALEVVSAVGIFSCKNARDPELDQPLRSAMGNGRLLKVKSVRRDRHDAGDSCVVHRADVCLSMEEVAL